MAHSIKFFDELGLVVFQFWGDLSYDEIQSFFDEAVKLPGFRPNLKAIADCRKATTRMTGKEIQKLASYAQKTDPLWGDSKWAILASSDLVYGLSRMYSALTTDYDVQTHVFRTVDEAKDWLGIDPVTDILLRTAE